MMKIFFVFFILFSALINATSLKKVKVQFQWKNQFEYAGFFVAKEKGFYKNIGLDVEFIEHQAGDDTGAILANKQVEYAVLRPSSIIDISKGSDIVYLAAIYQSSPLILLADRKNKIDKIYDFKNKKIMITSDHIKDSSLIALMRSQGIELENMQIIKHDFNPQSLLNGKTDLMAAYVSNEPFILKELGGDPIIFSSKDYGFEFYNDIISTTGEYLKQNRQEVKNFVNATLKGFIYAFSNIEKTSELIFEKYNSLNKSKQALIYEANELKKYAYYKTTNIGQIDLKRLEKIYDIYRLFGLAKHDLELENIVYNPTSISTIRNDIENEFLKNKKELIACISKNLKHPFISLNNSKIDGIVIEYLTLLEKSLNVKIHLEIFKDFKSMIKEIKTCDFYPFYHPNNQTQEQLQYTDTYISFPIVITTKNNVNFADHQIIKTQKIAFLKDGYIKKILKDRKYIVDFIEVENIKEGFALVEKGEVFGFVEALPVVTNKLQNSHFLSSLKISGSFNEPLKTVMATKKDYDSLILNQILQKELRAIDQKTKQGILNKWSPIEFTKQTNWRLIISIVSFFIIIIIILIYYNRKIARVNNLLKQYNNEINQSKQRIEASNKKLYTLANTDSLTKIYNRGRINEILKNTILLSDSKQELFSVCIFDIDHFKKINDTYGHQVGDKVLIKLCKIVKSQIRRADSLGRIGGEEFLLILSGVAADKHFEIANNIRLKVQEHVFEDFNHNITISLGVSEYKRGDTNESIIKRADDALYRAKKEGRNKVVIG